MTNPADQKFQASAKKLFESCGAKRFSPVDQEYAYTIKEEQFEDFLNKLTAALAASFMEATKDK